MKERLLVSTKQMSESASQWAQQSKDSIAPDQIVEQIAKQLQILSRVLTPLLLESQIQDIFAHVVKTFSDILAPVFERLRPDPDWDEELMDVWHEQWMVNCEFLINTLEGLAIGVENADIYLENLKRVSSAGPLKNEDQEMG